mmetsp:Transcript_7638/g.19645  ORF Transcript_7638/g.19645 Transcript_7638/m.19645 type:complete len:202 (-) Transcript_7638:1247-1852(-)
MSTDMGLAATSAALSTGTCPLAATLPRCTSRDDTACVTAVCSCASSTPSCITSEPAMLNSWITAPTSSPGATTLLGEDSPSPASHSPSPSLPASLAAAAAPELRLLSGRQRARTTPSTLISCPQARAIASSTAFSSVVISLPPVNFMQRSSACSTITISCGAALDMWVTMASRSESTAGSSRRAATSCASNATSSSPYLPR